MQVGMVGPYPPPNGGVSVHIKRLEENLRRHGVVVKVFDTNLVPKTGGNLARKLGRAKWLLRILTCPGLDILHIHGEPLWEQTLLIFMARARKMKTVVTFHSLRDELRHMTVRQRHFLAYVVSHADYVIAAGANERDKLVKWFNRNSGLYVVPTFIPPQRGTARLPESLTKFLANHRFIISANASNMNFYQGRDLYGLDMLIELSGQLSRQMDVGLVYCLTGTADQAYMGKIRSRIKELNIEKSFLILQGNLEFWPVLEKSHIFIRPTCTDSYGVSVAEALTLGVPSIASDVCQRPDGAVLFQSRNSEDLYNKVCDIIGNYDQYRAGLRHLKIESCAPAILRIYQDLAG